MKNWLLTDDLDQLKAHKASILGQFDANREFERHCLLDTKIVQRCFAYRFTDALRHVRSIHFTQEFKEEYKEILWSLSQLKRLYISNAAFPHVPSLKRLDIAGNPLSLPELGMFKKKRDELNPELLVDVLDTPHFQLI